MAQRVTCLLCCPEMWAWIPSTYVKSRARQNALTLALVTGGTDGWIEGLIQFVRGKMGSHQVQWDTLTGPSLSTHSHTIFHTQSLTNIEMTTIFKKIKEKLNLDLKVAGIFTFRDHATSCLFKTLSLESKPPDLTSLLRGSQVQLVVFRTFWGHLVS